MSSLPRILVVGGGGIGAVTALNLSTGAKVDVSLVLRSNYSAVMANGFEISSADHGQIKNWRPAHLFNSVPDVSNGVLAAFDYVICTTKNIADCSPTTLELLRPAITPNHTVIVLIQNGLNIQVPFISAFPNNIVLSGISYMGSHERLPAVIDQAYPDKLEIGAFRNSNVDQTSEEKAALAFVEYYGAGGKTSAAFVRDVEKSRWTKLVYNATMNPISAILRMKTGELFESGAVVGIVSPAALEIFSIADSKGVVIDASAMQSILQLNASDADFQPSMAVDVAKVSMPENVVAEKLRTLQGNPIEFENIVGEPLREAERQNVSAPFLGIVYELCKSLQWQMRRQQERSKST